MSIASRRLPAGSAGDDAPGETAASEPSLLGALWRLARPKQWIKNLLVFAAPAAAGVLDDPAEIGRTLVAFVALCLTASGTYFLNDARDVHADRQHPHKRHRPVAAGHVSEAMATSMSVVLILAGLLVTFVIDQLDLTALIAAYAALTICYSVWLKHEPVIDIGTVAAGFVLRTIAGGVATGVEISDWFLIVTGGVSLFIVTGKRYADQIEIGEVSEAQRATLTKYSMAYLSYVRAVASSIAIVAYCLWAFEYGLRTGDETWFRYSIVPFVLGILRYAHLVEEGRGGAPEDVLLSDRMIQVLGLIWAATFAIGVYA